MERTGLLFLLTAGVLVITACGGPAPTAEPTAVPSSTELPTPSSIPATATARPTATEAPGPETPAAAEGLTQVEVKLVDNTITSSLTTFKAGVPYTFVITNKGRREHNFIISPPVSVAGSYTEAFAQALLAVDETQLSPGTTATVDFTFPASSVGATLEFNCLIRRHYEDGMRLDITVTG